MRSRHPLSLEVVQTKRHTGRHLEDAQAVVRSQLQLGDELHRHRSHHGRRRPARGHRTGLFALAPMTRVWPAFHAPNRMAKAVRAVDARWVSGAVPCANKIEIGGWMMLVCTSWKARPLTREQTNRMMQTWRKLESRLAKNPSVERICWYIFDDGSGGMTVSKYLDVETATASALETSLALSEFLEFDSKIVLELDTAMPAILKAVEHINS